MPVQVFRRTIPEGDAGTAQTVRTMRALIVKGSRDARVRSVAVSVVSNIQGEENRIKALFDFVQSRVRYVRDPATAEMLGSAEYHMESLVRTGQSAGDCDDHAIVLGSMLESVGHPTRIVTARSSQVPGNNFDHVYLEAFAKGRGWIPLDPSVKARGYGFEPPNSRRRIW